MTTKPELKCRVHLCHYLTSNARGQSHTETWALLGSVTLADSGDQGTMPCPIHHRASHTQFITRQCFMTSSMSVRLCHLYTVLLLKPGRGRTTVGIINRVFHTDFFSIPNCKVTLKKNYSFLAQSSNVTSFLPTGGNKQGDTQMTWAISKDQRSRLSLSFLLSQW